MPGKADRGEKARGVHKTIDKKRGSGQEARFG